MHFSFKLESLTILNVNLTRPHLFTYTDGKFVPPSWVFQVLGVKNTIIISDILSALYENLYLIAVSCALSETVTIFRIRRLGWGISCGHR